MVYRIYVEKKAGLTFEANGLKDDLKKFLGIKGLEGLRILNRYDAENISEELFSYAVKTVFSEPQLDNVATECPKGADFVFAVEPLPGQFDQRAASAEECIQIISQGERPIVKTAKVYLLSGNLSEIDIEEIKKLFYLFECDKEREDREKLRKQEEEKIEAAKMKALEEWDGVIC